MAYKTSNTSELKKINRSSVYQLLYQKHALSKQDIAYDLKMSLPTVTQNLKELTEMGLICSGGTFDSTGGRKAKVHQCVSDLKIAIGVDITRSHIGILAVDLFGKILNQERKYKPFENTDVYYQMLGELVENFIDTYGLARERILGVGIAVPALFSEDGTKVVYGKVLDLAGVYSETIMQYIKYPSFIYHDSEVAGFAEFWAAKNITNAIYISLGSSIGGAVYLNSECQVGVNRRSGEVGHMTLVENGKLCYCGKRGCLDAYCSADALKESAGVDLEEFFAGLQKGNSGYHDLWDTYLAYLSTAIHNTIMAFDCPVILGGYVGMYLEPYIEELFQRVSEKCPFLIDTTYLVLGKYKKEAIAAGAALRLIEKYIRAI